jgi:hypothetical protein
VARAHRRRNLFIHGGRNVDVVFEYSE